MYGYHNFFHLTWTRQVVRVAKEWVPSTCQTPVSGGDDRGRDWRTRRRMPRTMFQSRQNRGRETNVVTTSFYKSHRSYLEQCDLRWLQLPVVVPALRVGCLVVLCPLELSLPTPETRRLRWGSRRGRRKSPKRKPYGREGDLRRLTPHPYTVRRRLRGGRVSEEQTPLVSVPRPTTRVTPCENPTLSSTPRWFSVVLLVFLGCLASLSSVPSTPIETRLWPVVRTPVNSLDKC